MTMPTPAAEPDPNDEAHADEENPAEGGEDTHFTEEQGGLDHDVVSPTQDAKLDEEPSTDHLHDTDNGTNG